MKSKYWHITCMESSIIVVSDDTPEASDGNAYGPFDTFGEAKRDAIDWHQTDKITANRAIAEIRKIRKSEVQSS